MQRSYDRAEGQSALHPVSAWAEERRLALGQLAVDDKSNEITALPRLEETRYYLLSQAFPPERFNYIARGHWGIENRLHWYWT